jgi:aldose 1-epimerase
VTFIRLAAGSASAVVAPEIGGSLLSFQCNNVHILRKVDELALMAAGPLGAACFPMTPWVSRIKNGRFAFAGRNAKLPPAIDMSPHSLHGLGWQRSWSVAEREEGHVLLEQDYEPPDWPWRARTRMRVRIEDAALEIALSLTNLDDTPMPGGLGLHPYFPREADTQVRADVAGVWYMDEAGFPAAHHPRLPGWNPSDTTGFRGASVDNVFTGWNRRAVIEQHDLRTVLIAIGAADFLIVYAPPEGTFVCVEPASSMTDAVNRPEPPAVTGLRDIAPGDALTLTMRLDVEGVC